MQQKPETLKIPASANPLTLEDLEEIGDVTEEDLQASIEAWNQNAGEYENLLEADPD